MSLKPGIYKATVRGESRECIVLVGNSEDGESLTYSLSPYGSVRRCYVIELVRPLIILDLKGMCSVPVLSGVLQAEGYGWLAEQIEAQTKPPRVPEPTDTGTLVRASQVGECDGSERTWVRYSPASTNCWIDWIGHIRSWSDLTDPELLPPSGGK